ncbi:MAG: aldehyde ferredoxin oxidoreductase N-terminal domain-containing protein, partial [Halobacteriales archaeon]|nr:aldehyde ferredoxin oxidoreductase N-terminal domain-containing protein [Halobacteriales archaeon]
MTLPPVYGGEVLHVDLETGESRAESIDEADARRFLGGNGFAAKLVHEHVPSESDPFDPENVVVFAVGPMNLTPFQSTSRGVVGFVSPMTNGFFDSTFGGSFPRAQKSIGFEAVVLHGKAPELCYVRLTEDGAEVVPAPELAGEETYDTCEAVREAEGQGFDTHVVAAGP